MKFWKRDGICGTMDDNGHVPDSEKATKVEYDIFVASLPVILEVDYKDEFSKLLTVDEKILYIAQRLKLV